MILTTSFYDINNTILTKRWFSKFQSILILQVKHDYVQWYCSIDFCVKSISVNENQCENCSHTEMISVQFLWGNVLLREKLKNDEKKNQNWYIYIYMSLCL